MNRLMNFALEKEDKMISTFLSSIGSWNNHVIIGGGFAPIIYKLYLSDHSTGMLPVGTRDLDSLISRKIPNMAHKKLSKHLIDSGFTTIFKNLEIPATQAYVKDIDGFELEVEFLTSSNFRGDKNKNIEIAGVIAQPLRYLELSLQNFIEFTTQSNNTGLVVSPETWIFHKGLTFIKRFSDSKIYKDLYGIWYVATQLGEFSDNAIIEVKDLVKQHSKWFKKFQKNIFEWTDKATPLDWTRLESQDPYGKLHKVNFMYLMKKWL